jgi:hypothetical protein
MVVYIAKNLETAVRGFTGFYPYYDGRLTLADTVTAARNRTLDMTNAQDRAIGIFNQAEIYVKPWVPSNYLFVYNRSAPRPLRRRVRDGMQGNLHIAAELEIYPLRAQFLEREYGLGVVNRANGACLLTNNATYSAPADWAF